MIYWLHLVGRHAVRFVPRAVAYQLAAVIASVVYWLWHEKRRHAIANLARVLGPQHSLGEARRLARQVFRNYGKYLVDMLRLSGWQLKEVERHLVVFGMEHVEAALARGKGLIFVGGHLGNSDLGGALLAWWGYPVHVIAERLHPPRWNELVQETRRLAGMNVIPVDASIQEVLQVLRRNEVLACLIDLPAYRNGNGVAVRFFDAWTRVPAGAATLALRTGASVIAACVVRVGAGYEVHIRPLAPLERTGDLQLDIQRLTQQIVTALEGFIRQYPDQWFMFRPMWPARAEG
ncbi:MAG TPA: hypothetical protein VFB73_17665 [Chloroflexota bacterium]|nr:hypothetical protein [Chloroflexota bacterium]